MNNNNLNYNKKRYLELLKVKDSQLTFEKIKEFNYYSEILSFYLEFETCQNYLQLLKEIVDEKIDSIKFSSKCVERYNLNYKVLQALEENFLILSPDQKLLEKSSNFSHFIEEIMSYCYLQYDGSEIDINRFNSPLLEAKYRASMEKIYRKIQAFTRLKKARVVLFTGTKYLLKYLFFFGISLV